MNNPPVLSEESSTDTSNSWIANFWTFFLDNRAFTYLLVCLSLAAGAYSISVIPKEATPEITIPIAQVATPFIGASAQDVETLVTNKIEKQIKNFSGVEKYTSTSAAGFSSIIVTFEQGEDIDERVLKLKESVEQVKSDLPRDGNDIRVQTFDSSQQPILTVALISTLPLYSFAQSVEQLTDELSVIDGVSTITQSGIPAREIEVLVDNRALLRHNIDFNTVVGRLSTSNTTLPGGSLDIDQINYPIDIQSQVTEFDQISKIPLVYRADTTVVVGDVAKFSNGFADRSVFTQVGYPGAGTLQAVTLNISKKAGGDVSRVTSDVRNRIESLSDTVLVGIDHVVTRDAGADVGKQLGALLRSGMQTILLVFIVLMIFVGFRESLIAAISIPFSFMLAFVAFVAFGNTINFISLFAMILSIGILVDSAIVVVEGVNAKIKSGLRRDQAAKATIREFGVPLFAGTMTTVAVFLPLLFLSGVTGQFIRGIPFTVSLVLLASLFVSLGFVSVFCLSFLRGKQAVIDRKPSWAQRAFARLEAVYSVALERLLGSTIHRRMFQVGITLISCVSIALVPLGLVGVYFFPDGDINVAYITIELEQSADISDTRAYAQQIEPLLQQDYIDSYVSTVGRSSAFGSSVIDADHLGNITLNINADYQSQGSGLLDELKAQLMQYEHAELVVNGGGPPTGAAVDVSFTATDTELLRSTVRAAERALRSIPGTENIASTLSKNASGFNVVVDRHAANRFGVSLSDIATVVRGTSDGIEVFTITEQEQDVPVMVRNGLQSNTTLGVTPDMLRALSVQNNRGQSIVLGTMIDVNLAETDTTINHTDGARVVSLSGGVSADILPATVRAEFVQQLDGIVPDGVEYSFGGEQKAQKQSFTEVGIAFVVGVFLMFSILILQFGRWRQVLIVMSVLLYALAGVLVGLFLSGNALSFPSILGTIALFGIVVNNSIILVSVFNGLRKEHPDWDLDTVIVQGSMSRLRPIVLTTATTVIGVSPLLTASAIWAPIAYALIFGLLFCVMVTLFMVPLLYRRFEGFSSGGWDSVYSWIINVLVVLMVPLAVLAAVVSLGIFLSVPVAVSVYGGFSIACICGYIYIYRRAHK